MCFEERHFVEGNQASQPSLPLPPVKTGDTVRLKTKNGWKPATPLDQ